MIRVTHGIWHFEALQYKNDDTCNCHDIDEFIGETWNEGKWECDESTGAPYTVDTTFGPATLESGDWIVRRRDNPSMFWRIKENIFPLVFSITEERA